MSRHDPPGIHTIRGLMGVCHLLVDERGEAVLLDTGLVGERWQIRRVLRRLGLGREAVKAILLTHGHIDHAGNLAWAKHWTGAPVYAHPAEQAHIDGTYAYTGAARWCGRMERIGYRVLNYQRASIDRTIADGDELPFWGGLRVVHLPGHTEGHCGFFSPKHDLLFSGDLFASYFFNVHLPPAILNSRPELLRGSLERVLAMNPRLMIPQHYDILDGALHRERFHRMCERLYQRSERRSRL
jgi:glyoxylase-like metal-dependent hydrolase (beta-lactamase superfamily II)